MVKHNNPAIFAGLEDHEILLIYDRECPFCEAYCRLARIREAVGTLQLVDARQESPAMQEITRQGLDIDEGMVLKLGDQLYYGSDAIQVLASMSSRSGLFNRLNYRIFRSPKRAHLIYPVLRLLRNLMLKLMRKTRINNLQKTNNSQF